MVKKRSPGDGGLYYLPKRGLWRATIELGYGPDGRRKQKHVHSRTQRGARDKAAAIRAEISEHGAPLDRATTLESWAEHWLTTVAKPHLKPNTYIAYSSLTRRWIVPTIGRKRVANLKPSDVRAVAEAMRAAGKSSSSSRQAYRVLSQMLESAHDEGLCGTNVAAQVKAPKKAATDRGAFTREQAMAILRATMPLPDRTRWWAGFTMGLRQSEALGLRWEDVDLTRGQVSISWSLEEVPREHGCPEADPCGHRLTARCPQWRWRIPDGFELEHLRGRWCLIRPKNATGRSVPLIAPVVTELQRWQQAMDGQPNPHGLVWPADSGSHRTPRDDGQAWRNLLHAAGVIPAEQLEAGKGAPGTHWARHTVVTVLMELGIDPTIVGEIVGHGSVEVTRGYQHVSSDAAREAVTKLGARWGEALIGQ